MNEPELAEAIGRLRGEWGERTGGELQASAFSWEELSKLDSVDADVLVFPSRYVGELGARGWLRPVRPNVLESEELRANDFFPLARRELITWDGQVMALPLGVGKETVGVEIEHNPAIAFLQRAAPKTIARERLGELFASENMTPKINEPVYVEVLADLIDEVGDGKDALPVERTIAPVPVLGYADRLVGVTSGSRNATTAFKLVEWLASADTSTELSRSGSGTLPSRRSLASSPQWYDASVPQGERAALIGKLEAALSQTECLMIPRIPGVDEYLAALDKAVKEALSGEVTPQAALENAAAQWEEITDARGRDAQREAYLKHLGVAKP